MAETPVLNWYAKEPRMVRGLRTAMSKKRGAEYFVTLRLGTKWAQRLNPGKKVAISVSDDPGKPNILGYALVVSVAKKELFDLSLDDLRRNIGARNCDQVFQDMQAAYSTRRVFYTSIITVIELVRL